MLIETLVFVSVAAITEVAITSSVFRHDWCASARYLGQFLFDVIRICLWVGIQPRLAISQSVTNLLLLLRLHLFAEATTPTRDSNGGLHRPKVAVESVPGIHALLDNLIFLCETFRLIYHLFNLFLS